MNNDLLIKDESMASRFMSIAVLPFENLSDEPDAHYFARGFAEDLISKLTRFDSLRVVASQSSFAANTLDKPLTEILREWELDYFLEGSIRVHNEKLRVGAHLINAKDLQTVWADQILASFNNLFVVQDEIASTVAGKLAVQIREVGLANAKRAANQNLKAYDCWLRGMDCLKRSTLEGDEESREFFQQALTIDPFFAKSYAGLSLSHFNEWTCQAWHLWDESSSNAFDYALKAVEIDDSDALVHAILARVYRYRHQHNLADEHVARAIALNPNDPAVLIQVALCMLFNGDPESALHHAEKAIAYNPLHPAWQAGTVGWCHFMAGRPEQALPHLIKGRDTIVNFGAYRAACYVFTGETDKAREEYLRFEREYQKKITFGREPKPGEALQWAVQVEPFRVFDDSKRMPETLYRGGIAEIDVERTIRDRPNQMVRPASIECSDRSAFVREGEIWTVEYMGSGAKLPKLKGFNDIARLLAEPHISIHCLELIGAPSEEESKQPVIDQAARNSYRKRVEELHTDLQEAEAANDPARAERLQEELDVLMKELSRVTGFAGRPRQLGDRAERARSAITWRIRSAIKKIQSAHPRLGSHLSNSIQTGTFCVYVPESEIHWVL